MHADPYSLVVEHDPEHVPLLMARLGTAGVNQEHVYLGTENLARLRKASQVRALPA